MPNRQTASLLAQFVEGRRMIYQSETDAPWQVIDWPDATGDPNKAEVCRRGHHKARSPTAQETADAFFAPLIQEQDWYGDEERADARAYRELQEIVGKVLRNATVIQVGKRQVTIYLVGLAAEGGWAGLKTTAVET
jgi:Nuclease A inhibitor-like protein